jgi:hypothetical protein
MTSSSDNAAFGLLEAALIPPPDACTDQEKLAAHSKPFSPGPSIPHPYTGPPFIPIVSQGVVLPPKKDQASKSPVFPFIKKNSRQAVFESWQGST